MLVAGESKMLLLRPKVLDSANPPIHRMSTILITARQYSRRVLLNNRRHRTHKCFKLDHAAALERDVRHTYFVVCDRLRSTHLFSPGMCPMCWMK